MVKLFDGAFDYDGSQVSVKNRNNLFSGTNANTGGVHPDAINTTTQPVEQIGKQNAPSYDSVMNEVHSSNNTNTNSTNTNSANPANTFINEITSGNPHRDMTNISSNNAPIQGSIHNPNPSNGSIFKDKLKNSVTEGLDTFVNKVKEIDPKRAATSLVANAILPGSGIIAGIAYDKWNDGIGWFGPNRENPELDNNLANAKDLFTNADAYNNNVAPAQSLNTITNNISSNNAPHSANIAPIATTPNVPAHISNGGNNGPDRAPAGNQHAPISRTSANNTPPSQRGGGGGGNSDGGGSGRIICTELWRQGLLTKEEVRAELKFTKTHLTQIHINGYHYFAIPMVKLMRKSKLATKVWSFIASNRIKDVKWRSKTGKFNLTGRVINIILENLSFVLGNFVTKQNTKQLYKEEKFKEIK